MSYKFDMSNVKDSLTYLYNYVSEMTGEKAWKCDPIISDSPTETSIKFPHPNATSKDLKGKSEPFSSLYIRLQKSDSSQLSIELTYDNKKAISRIGDMLQTWNRTTFDNYLGIVNKLDCFSFKMQVKTTYKKTTIASKYEDIFITPSNSVNFTDVVQNFEKATTLSSSTVAVEDGNAVKSKVPCIIICKDFSIDNLALEQSSFSDDVKALHELMLIEPKILSEKDLKKTTKMRKKDDEKDKFYTIVSNRVDQQFYCRLTNAEFQRKPEHFGIQVWNIETLEEKKYIRAALKLVKEI